RCKAAAVLMAGLVTLSGCVSVKAPDKPIVIELNINIKQEVIYRLAQDAQKTVEENGDVF
ncbi:MAG: YnbE family lipoprotein, partial [Novosphingobium sp.]